MRRRKFCGELFLPRLRPLLVDELKEIKADPNAVDADQIRDVLDVIDVPIERAFFRSRAHEDGIYADHPATFSNHLDLFVANIAFDVVVPADVRVRDDGRLRCDRENLVKPGRVYVRKINNHAERFAFTHDVATKRSEPLPWRAARGENSAVSRRIASRMRE